MSEHILFIQPLFYDPTLPNFKDRFEMLSELYTGHVIASTNTPEKYQGLKFGEFEYHPLKHQSNKIKRYLSQMINTIKWGRQFHKAKPLTHIHSYDPLFFGFCATVLKKLTGAKLLIEVNGHLKKDGFLENKGFKQNLKRNIFVMLARFSLKNADIVKFLNAEQKEEWEELLGDTKYCYFHDFVPTHVFNPETARDGRYIFFIGHPFYRKAVDILIKAFIRVSPKHPDVKLTIVGHCHGREKERDKYRAMAEGNTMVELLEPVYYQEAIEYFQNCTMFILPSRSEAMGRVLIEAMAAGKPVIGSNVGGIPDVVEDNGCGFLFESENIEDLADKMDRLLSDQDLYSRMSARGLEIVRDKFSSQCYVKKFKEMIDAI